MLSVITVSFFLAPKVGSEGRSGIFNIKVAMRGSDCLIIGYFFPHPLCQTKALCRDSDFVGVTRFNCYYD